MGEPERERLLGAMATVGTHGRGAWRSLLLPRPAEQLLDPSVVVVLGARGAGKTEVATTLCQNRADRIETRADSTERDAPATSYVGALSFESLFGHDLNAIARWDDAELRRFWLNGLVNAVAPEAERLLGMRLVGGQMGETLDQIERALARGRARGTTITAVYDALDWLEWVPRRAQVAVIESLLALWAELSKRHDHLLAKIFVPSDCCPLDLFCGPGVDDLMVRASRLDWDLPSLYRLVFYQLGATGGDVRSWLESFGVRFRVREVMDWIPDEPHVDVIRRWLAATLPTATGVDARGGSPERWIADHLRDGHGRVAPASMTGFFCEAATHARTRPSGGHLLTMSDAMSAIDTMAARRVESSDRVYRRVDLLRSLAGRTLPLHRNEVEVALSVGDTGFPHVVTLDHRADTTKQDGRAALERLIRLGLLKELDGGARIDMPDLFVRHFDVRRAAPTG